jgi:hypothetical protein
MVALTMGSEKLQQKNRQNHSVPCRDRNQCLQEDIDVLLLARISPKGLT